VSEARLVQDGSCSRAVGAQLGDRLPVGCAGNCWQAPATSDDGGATWVGGGTVWQRPGEVRLLRDVGRRDPLVPNDHLYESLERALAMDGAALLELVRASGLRGRGGAYFPVGAKWATARDTPAQRKVLLVNAEEGEPGIYKDRHLLEGDPHRVLAGAQIAAHGIGATEIVVFINGAARLARDRLGAALARARELGLMRVPVEVRAGAGGYVLGEETALINAIHGQRSEPLARPPFPAQSGLWACPTVINNVESLANLPDIVSGGVEWFRSVGTTDNPGTKLVSLAGDVARPGLYEVPLGTPLARIIDDGGGGVRGRLGAILAGGPSGSILPAALSETPFDVAPLQAVGGILGAGGLVVLDESRCVVDAVRELVAYNARESCGKCTPCREGTVRLLATFDALGTQADKRLRVVRLGSLPGADPDTLDLLLDVIGAGSLCGLGQMAPNPVRALQRHFAAELDEHRQGTCRAGTCTFVTPQEAFGRA
jgi:NADH:ubiquinone oxidoreductase subunit F (NADH-binding)